MGRRIVSARLANLFPVFILVLTGWQSSIIVGFSVEEYCNFFTSDVRPLICIFKGLVSTTPSPHWNQTNSTWVWEEDCRCDLSCWPKFNLSDITDIFDPGWRENKQLLDNITSLARDWFYVCNSCGSECPLNQSSSEEEFVRPRCSCALIGSSSLAKCSCTATCATFRGLLFHKHIHHRPPPPWGPRPPPPPHYHRHGHHPPQPHPLLQKLHHKKHYLLNHHEYEHEDHDEDDDDEEEDEPSSNCIFTVNNVFDGLHLTSTRNSEPLSCNCGRSKRAETTQSPDFVCLCQQA